MQPHHETAAIVGLARALADETRVQILTILAEQEATVSDLATRLALPQPRISTHLKVLATAGLVSVETAGRHRVYRVDAPQVRQVFTALRALVASGVGHRKRPSVRAAREVRQNTPLRQARTCYDHLAGVVGVTLLDTLVRRKWVVQVAAGARPTYDLTAQGRRALCQRGVDMESAQRLRRTFACGCPDWTERRPHLGGALGAGILTTLLEAGYLERQDASRAVTLGTPLQRWFASPRNALG